MRGPPTFANTLSLTDIEGFGEDDIYVVGSDGYVAWFDGSSWTRLKTGTDHNLYAILLKPDGLICIAGQHGALLRGAQDTGFVNWSDPTFTAEVLSLTWYEDLLYLGTRAGAAVLDGGGIRLVDTGLRPPLADAHVIDAVDGVLWAFGYEDVVRFDGTEWRRYPQAAFSPSS